MTRYRAIRFFFASLAIAFLAVGCGIYTFSGSTLPAHLKTIDIPLFVNQSMQPDVAEAITSKLTEKVSQQNLLKNIARNGDATINGKVLSYTNQPYTYGSEGYRNVNISQYAVTIKVEVSFWDNKKDQAIYEGTITGEGIYDFSTKTEADGRTLAITKIIDQVIQNSVQGW
jgi:hypothetical protein